MTVPTFRRIARAGALASALAGVALLGGPAAAQPAEDPALDQVIERDQAVATGRTVLRDGHVDIGPRLVDDSFTLMVHDDGVVPAVWRSLDETVLALGDEALLTVPDDPAYAFLGVDGGTQVYVVPQVQRPSVVWVGWNTQDPAVMERIDRGATLALVGVQGPGEVTMYLQSGALGEPEVLWQSRTAERQPIWVEVNTHTHANWVFTEPGVYLVQVEVSANLLGGEPVRDVRTLRFAVGSAIDPGDAFDVVATAPPPPASAPETPDETPDDAVDDGGPPVLAITAAVAVLLAGVAAVVGVRSARAKRRADAERAATGAAGER